MVTRSQRGIFKPKRPYVGMVVNEEVEPETTEQALQDSQWKKAMEDEFTALTKNCTWTLVPYIGQKNVIDC